VSFDLLMTLNENARDDGVGPEFRLNNAAMHLVIDVLAVVDAVDWEDEPIYPAASGHEEVFDAARMRWEAERRVKYNALGDAGAKLPAHCFSSNDDWLVFPAECRAVSRAAGAVDDSHVRTAIEADADEVAALARESDPDTPDLDAAAARFIDVVRRFGTYCEVAAGYGGFRVG
jgi:hypothetical protein